jgi:OHCU decarboxylase
MTLDQLNDMSARDAEAEFAKCCGSHRWAQAMSAARPFESKQRLLAQADEISSTLTDEDWLEAFRAHPKIGEQKAAAGQSPQEANWSAHEQSGMTAAAGDTVNRLAGGNRDYEAKFGFIFIVCASGKSSDEMLSILNDRLENDPSLELRVAAGEQKKITRLRLEKLLNL